MTKRCFKGKTHHAVAVGTDLLSPKVLTLNSYVAYPILFVIMLDGR